MKKNKSQILRQENNQTTAISTEQTSSNQQSKVDTLIKPYIALIIFSVLTLLFFNSLLSDSYFWEDFTEYVLPHQTYAAKQFALGYIPFWNNFSFAGMPFLADLQVGFFYPLNRVLNLFLSNGKLPVGALELIIVLHFVIAQFNFWNLSKSFGVSSLSSILGAVTYSFSMLMICHVIHPMMIYHLAWFPLILMFFRNALIGNNYIQNLRNSILSGLVFGFTILSGHPQMMLYISLSLLFTFLFYFIQGIVNKEKTVRLLSIGGFAIIPILIGIGIFAIQLLPSLELAKESRRNENTIKLASEGSLEYSQILSVFNPDIYGKVEPTGKEGTNFYLNYKGDYKTHYYWETAFYFGLSAVILSLFYFMSNYKNPEANFLIFLSLFGLLYALGQNSFLWHIFYNLPYFGTFRNPVRMTFLLITAFSLAAGLGLDKIFSTMTIKSNDTKQHHKNDKNNSLLSLYVAIGVTLCVVTLLLFGGFNSAFNVPDNLEVPGITDFLTNSFTKSLFIVLSAAVILILGFKRILNYTITSALIILLTFVDLYSFGSTFNSSPQNPEDTYKIDENIKKAFQVDNENNPQSVFRVNSRMYSPSYMALPRNIGLMENIMLLEGYNPLVLDKVHPPVGSMNKVNDLQNVKYEIEIDKQQNAPRFFENVNRLGFLWFNDKYIKIASNKIESFLKENDHFDFNKVAILEEDISSVQNLNTADKEQFTKRIDGQPDSLGNLIREDKQVSNVSYKILRYNSEFMEVEVDLKKPGLVVFSEVFYPAIKLTVNNSKAKLLRANYSLRAVELKQGKSIVRMSYESEQYSNGKILTITTLLLSVLGFVFTYKDRFFKR